MSQPCRRGGCPLRKPSELDALVSEFGCSLTPLSAPIDRILADIAHMDGAVSVTSNPVAVMTQLGCVPVLTAAGDALPAPSAKASLRAAASGVVSAVAVDRPAYGRTPCSVQFFGADGATVHKIFLASLTDDYAFAELARDWCSETPTPAKRAPSTPADPLYWRCRDLAFHVDSLLGDAGLRRRESLPGWGADHAWRIDPELAVHLLGLVTEIRAPIMKIVPNAAFVQMHVGAFDSMRRAGDRLKLSAGDCALSLNLADVEEAWVTRHDHDGRPAFAVELYDWGYQCAAQLTATGGDPRLSHFWRRTVGDIPKLRR